MLTPEQWESLADGIVNLYDELNAFLVRDIVRRLVNTEVLTATALYEIEMMMQAGQLRQAIIKEVARLSKISEKDVAQLFEDAAVESLALDDSIYRAAGLKPLPIKQSPALFQSLLAGIKKTNGVLYNLTMTTANAAQTSYIKACNTAYFQVSTGAVSYAEAIRRQLRELADTGAEVLYPSGHTDKLDVAVRRSVVTGVAQTTGAISEMRAQDMGCDLMEITAHAGARPSHAEWQGKVVSLSGRAGYLSKADIGYGTGPGFKGYNCRHDWYPFYEGISERVYSPDNLEKLNEKSVEYNGKKYTAYEASQIQRGFERGIRNAKNSLLAIDAATKGTTDGALKDTLIQDFGEVSARLSEHQLRLAELIDKTGFKQDYSRTEVVGFGRSIAQRAVRAARKALGG